MFFLSEQQNSLRREIRDFVEQEISPIAAQLDASGEYPLEIVRKIGQKGFCSFPFPSALGGAGLGLVESVLFLEEISRGMASLGLIFCAHMLPCCYTMLNLVNERQKRDWLIPGIRAEKLLTFAISEPRGGSDAFTVDTIAERCPEGWLLNGSKCWITNAGVADGYIVNAKTSVNSRSRRVCLFHVDARADGVIISKNEDMIGLNNSPTGTITFKNCLLPPDALIGQENEGYRPIKTALNYGRLGLSAVAVGLAQAAFERAVEFSSNHGNFGRTLSSYQGVSFPVAEMYTNISLARNMLYHVADASGAGMNTTLETAALKLFSTEMCQKVCQDAVLIHGSRGFRSHCDVERMLRDSQLLTVAEGTSQICKVVISNGIYNAVPNRFREL
ncbi:MAG: acyl-CoA dehydrogenase family protein [Firmicutes bacterium]|nr:acyl-CoA dehydrogenase family protein [Bacillota bacterium]